MHKILCAATAFALAAGAMTTSHHRRTGAAAVASGPRGGPRHVRHRDQ